MKITAVDSAKDLFLVEEMFAPELLLDLSTDNIDWELQGEQKNFPREVVYANTCDARHSFYKMAQYLNGPDIEMYFTKFFGRDTLVHTQRIWYDKPGFHMKEHIDGGEQPRPDVALQIYLGQNQGHSGTTFYHMDKSMRYNFEYNYNTGYLMKNNKTQLHGVKPNTCEHTRLSIYVGMDFLN